MNLFHQFARCAPNKVFFAILLGALAGLCYALLIPIVVSGIAGDADGLTYVQPTVQTLLFVDISWPRFAALFFVSCVVILAARTISQLILVDVSINYTADLRIALYRRILQASVRVVEGVGLPKLNTVLTEDVRRVVWGARLLPDLLVNLVTVLGMLAYLFYLSADSFWFVMKVLVVGVITYQIPVLFANRQLKRSRELTDDLHESIRGLVLGIKELKLDQKRREGFFRQVLCFRETALARSDKRAFTTMAIANNYGDLLSFFVIGTIPFIFVNYHPLSSTQIVGIVMVLLYLAAPIAGILAFVPEIADARISLHKIRAMEAQLDDEGVDHAIHPVPDWSTITIRDLSFKHQADEGRTFQVGPMSLEIRRGEVTFVVGGNGSGKSTLAKLLSLHYVAESGSIRFGSLDVGPATIESLRQEVAAIYSDYFLFDRLLGDMDTDTLDEANRHLQALGLDHKVSIVDGRFSTLALSDGQKRRVALLVAFLDNKNLYIFDEWAADQDPGFKETFYCSILPELKARGKAVVVISHDDRYFRVADRIIALENGQLVSMTTPDRAPTGSSWTAADTEASRP